MFIIDVCASVYAPEPGDEWAWGLAVVVEIYRVHVALLRFILMYLQENNTMPTQALEYRTCLGQKPET